jgi:hypothetical protein
MRFLLFFCLILICCAACDPCANLDCIDPFDNFEFSYLTPGGDDLLGGESHVFTEEDLIIFYVLDQTDTISNGFSIRPGNPSVVSVYLQSTETLYLAVNRTVKDTIDLDFNFRETECCGRVARIAGVNVNGTNYSGELPVTIYQK